MIMILRFLDDFPEDSVFKENQFVELENGVYLNIIDKGTSQRAVQYKTKMLYRCKVSYRWILLNGYLLVASRTMVRIVMELILSRLHMEIIRTVKPYDPSYYR